jgi:uncharacterized damage-inducible protein DinB
MGNHISKRLQEVYLDGTLVAFTNYKKMLSDVTWAEAITQVNELNTIAKLTFHINYYLEGVLHVFNGGALEIRDKYSFDMDALQSASDWEALRSRLLSNAEAFIDHVATLSEIDFDQVFVDEKYGTYRRNMDVVIEHSYYHLGQISLIKKMVRGI